MKVNPIPSEYNRVMPYLVIPRAGDFIGFTKSVFDASLKMRMGPPGGPVMHGEVRIGDSVEPMDKFYGDRIAMIEDPHGVKWCIGSKIENLTEEEMIKRAREQH